MRSRAASERGGVNSYGLLVHCHSDSRYYAWESNGLLKGLDDVLGEHDGERDSSAVGKAIEQLGAGQVARPNEAIPTKDE